MMKKRLMGLMMLVLMLVIAGNALAVNVLDETVFVPLQASDIPKLPEMPTIPTFSNLREEDGHLVIDVDINGATHNLDSASINCYAFSVLDDIDLTYDAATSTFISETMPSFSLDKAYFNYEYYEWDWDKGSVIVTAQFNANLDMMVTSITTYPDGKCQNFAWQNDGRLWWYYGESGDLGALYDEKGNLFDYWYTALEIDHGSYISLYGVTYNADDTLYECTVEVDGEILTYRKGAWRDSDGQVIPAPEGYDLAKLTEMYPPLSHEVQVPTNDPTATPAPDATPEPATESTPEPTAEPTPEPTPTPTPNNYTWYSHNTLGLIGLPLRDLYPDLTDKWYNVIPVDLTRQGTQTFPMAASNLYYMGSACVEVSGDSVTVTYETPSGQWKPYLKVEDETLAWFTSAADITADFLNNPASETKFGEAVSIAGDLKGQDVALLFICNHVTYRQPFFGETGYLTRYWPNLSQWKEYRQNLQTLMTYLPE